MAKEELAAAAVNKIEKTFGEYPAYRRAHARGAGYEAVFTATGEGKNWTVAPHFRQGTTRAIVRFSHSSPDPFWTDNFSPVKGMAVQFKLPGQQVMNSVGVTSPIFFTRTPEVFTEMLDIAKSFKKGRPRLRALITLFIKYPKAGRRSASSEKCSLRQVLPQDSTIQFTHFTWSTEQASGCP
nr:catalase [Planococcus salinarum]